MATEFELEQLRSLFLTLADKLSKTKGDEATLSQLEAVEDAIRNLNKEMVKQASKGPKGKNNLSTKDISQSLIDALNKAQPFKKAEDALNKIAENSANPSSGMDISLDSLPGASTLKSKFGALAAGIGAVNKSTSGFARNFTRLTDGLNGSFSGLATGLGLGETAFGTMAKALDVNVNAYRSLVTSAEGSIGSIGDMRKAMSTAAMSATEFADAIKSGTDGTRLLGGQNWAQLYKSIKLQSQDMGYYGYTLEGLAKAQNEYLGILVDRGDINRLSQKGIADGLQNLLQVNDQVATILGKDREDMLKRLAAESQDVNFNTFLKSLGDRLGETGKTELAGIQATLTQLHPLVASAFKDMVMTGGAILDTEAANAFSTLGPEMQKVLTDTASSVRAGNVNAGDAVAFTQTVKNASARDEPYRDNESMAILGRTNGGGFEASNAAAINAANLRSITDQTTFGSQQNDAVTKSLLQFQGMATDARALVNDAIDGFVKPLVDQFGPALTSSVDAMRGENGWINTMRESVNSLTQFDTALKTISGYLIGGTFLAASTGMLGVILSKTLVPVFKSVGLGIYAGAKGAATGVGRAAGAAGTGIAKSAAVAKGVEAIKATEVGAKAVGATSKVGEMASKALNSGVASKLTKALGPLAVVLQGLETYSEIESDYDRKESGEITEEEFKKLMSQHIGAGLGGVGGAILGAKILGAGGAAAGSVVPGLGTVGGGVVGAVGGAIGGAFAGDALGDEIGAIVYDYILAKDEAAPSVTPVDITPPTVSNPAGIEDNNNAIGLQNTLLLDEIKNGNSSLRDIAYLLRTANDMLREQITVNKTGLEDLNNTQSELARRIRANSL